MKCEKKLRIGIVGLGRVATATHIPVLRRLDDVDVTACAETNTARVKRVREFLDIPNVFNDYQAMYTSKLLDAVYVCVPPHVHCDATISALRNGIHVLCEKPMGRTTREAVEMSRIAREKNLVLMPGFKYRYNQNIQQAAKIIHKGLLGSPIQVQATFMTPGPYISWDPKSEWYLETEQGGVVYDIGVHIIELLHTLVPNRISVVYSHASEGYCEYKTPTNVSCSFVMENGTTGTIVFGWRCSVDFVNVSVFGTGGAISVGLKSFDYFNAGTDPKDRILSNFRNSCVELKTVIKRISSIVRGKEVSVQDLEQAKAFVKAIRDEEEPPVVAEEAVYVHQVLEAIMSSIETHEPKEVRDIGCKNDS